MLAIRQFVVHPGYDSVKRLNDIALMQLKVPAVWNDFVQPVCVPSADGNQFIGVLATVSGWGSISENGCSIFLIFHFPIVYIEFVSIFFFLVKFAKGPMASSLLKVGVPIIDNAECQQWFRAEKKPVDVTDTVMCAGFEHGRKDACQGWSFRVIIYIYICRPGHPAVNVN